MTTATAAPIRVKIVHQSRIMRECLAAVLSESGSFVADSIDHSGLDCLRVPGKTRSDDTAELTSESVLRDILKELAVGAPQVLLIDLNLPNQLALELAREVHDQPSAPGIVVLTHAPNHDDLIDCFAAGAHGCVPENSSVHDLCEAIATVAGGGVFCSSGLIHSMFHRMSQRNKDEDLRDEEPHAALTPRELEIVSLIGEHLSNKQIAKRLSVSLYTIKNHVHNIVEKLQVSGRYEAVDYVRKRNLLGSARLTVPCRREP